PGATPVALEAAVPLTIRDEPARVHRIADGDTLETIAERYLGDRREWRSIFSHNHEILTDPAILPIGQEIRIPASATSPHDDDRLVPIPPGLLNRD
ncbi:MAG: tail protein X, partial [Planctomycetia bacterium]|nr:tail protein X [Planctomycetia bacterium]